MTISEPTIKEVIGTETPEGENAVIVSEAGSVAGATARGTWRKVFSATGEFEAFHDAEIYLLALGFSVGRSQGPAPVGVMFGEWEISKWRNMSKRQQAEVHGTITGDHRHGPVAVTIYGAAPQEAHEAIRRGAK